MKCDGCYDDVWTIAELTSKEFLLVNYQTEETATYKKVFKRKTEKNKDK